MSIEGQGHFFTIYFPGFVCFVLYWAKISGECLQDHWSSGFLSYATMYLNMMNDCYFIYNYFFLKHRNDIKCKDYMNKRENLSYHSL